MNPAQSLNPPVRPGTLVFVSRVPFGDGSRPATCAPLSSPAAPAWLDSAEYPFRRHYIALNGHAVHYVDEGEGPPLLIVHAGPGWSFMYRNVIQILRKSFRCVLPDFPGTGLSASAPTYPHTLEAGGELLESFVKALNLDKAVLWVHGLGGPVGLSLAAQRADLFNGLVISDTFAFPLDSFRIGRTVMGVVGSGAFSRINRATNLMARAMSTPFGAGRSFSSAGRALFRAAYGTDESRRYGSRLMRSCVESADALQRTASGLADRSATTPALILFGEKDNAIRLGFEAEFRRIFPHSDRARVKGAHHFPMSDDPEAVADIIRAWWGSRFGSDESGIFSAPS